MCYDGGVRTIPQRTLRNRISEVLRQVEAGERVRITVDGRPVAELVAEARRTGRRPTIMDAWIAATAVAHDLPVYTQDEDFLAIPRVRVVRV